MSEYAVGVDLGGTSIKAALVERRTGIQSTVCMDTGAAHGPEHVLSQVEAAVSSLIDVVPVSGIGIGAPGTTDLARTTLIHPPNISGWARINLRVKLQERLGRDLHVVVENDANAAALGSAHYGAGRCYDSFLMVTLGTGVGGAIVVDNRIFRGTTGAAGEIGHMTIDYDGPQDRAGVAGAIEAYVGQRFLSTHARQQLGQYSDSMLYDMAGKDLAALTPAMLSAAAGRGDPGALAVLHWAGHKLGCVLGSCINLLDIRVVIVGGGVSQAGAHILEPAREVVLRYVKPGMRNGVIILRETLGNEAGMLGAACLVFEHTDSHDSSARGT